MIRDIIKYLINLLIRAESYLIKPLKSSKKKLLIIRKDGLGDYILFYPTLKYYREIYPDYEITLIVSVVAKDLIPKMTWVDKFIVFDKNKFGSNFLYRRNFLLDLKKQGFSIAIYPVVTRENAADLMIKLTDAKEKVEFYSDKIRNNIYSKLIKIPENIDSEIDRNLHFIRMLGATVKNISFPTLNLSAADVDLAEKIITNNNLDNKKICVVFPGSNYNFKIWPVEKYSELINYITSKDITPIICGSESERVLVEKIIQRVNDPNKVINLAGKTENIFTLAGILKRSLFYVGSDTGIAHLSAAITTPTICLMGGGHFGRFFPYGDLNKNKIVYDKKMKCMNDNWRCVKDLLGNKPSPCIENIRVEDIKKEINMLINIT